MSQETRPESPRQERPTETTPPASTNPSNRMMEEVLSQRPNPPVTDLNGRECRNQPENGQIPVLRAGEKTSGCNFQSFDRTPEGSAMPPFNTGQLYEQAQRQTARIKVEEASGGGGHGTGVAIGRNEDTCFIATANHVSGERSNQNIVSRGAEFANGKTYPASIETRIPGKDMAVLSVRTGADTNQVCHPAQIAANPFDRSDRSGGGQTMTAGFPEGTNTLHASPGRISRVGTYEALTGGAHPSPMAGERVNRPLIETRAQNHQGNSGGPTYNSGGEVIGLSSGVHPDERKARSSAQITPISRAEIGRILQRIPGAAPLP